jgi:hypothetical protein
LQEKKHMLTDGAEENNFEVALDGTIYRVTDVSSDPYDSRFKIEREGRCLFTLRMDEEGNWLTTDNENEVNESLVAKVGRAIEEHDLR